MRKSQHRPKCNHDSEESSDAFELSTASNPHRHLNQGFLLKENENYRGSSENLTHDRLDARSQISRPPGEKSSVVRAHRPATTVSEL